MVTFVVRYSSKCVPKSSGRGQKRIQKLLLDRTSVGLTRLQIGGCVFRERKKKVRAPTLSLIPKTHAKPS